MPADGSNAATAATGVPTGTSAIGWRVSCYWEGEQHIKNALISMQQQQARGLYCSGIVRFPPSE